MNPQRKKFLIAMSDEIERLALVLEKESCLQADMLFDAVEEIRFNVHKWRKPLFSEMGVYAGELGSNP